MTDPVCGMEIGKGSKFSSSYKGIDYHFCSKSCKDAFDRNQGKYVK